MIAELIPIETWGGQTRIYLAAASSRQDHILAAVNSLAKLGLLVRVLCGQGEKTIPQQAEFFDQ
jgi:hypothetical protein